jgi:3-oxoacyl-[acyl-carrier protein] reductase
LHRRLINVTSSAGITGTLGQVNYSAAKAGVIGFTKSLARELATKTSWLMRWPRWPRRR